MKLFELTLPSMVLRFYLMMAVVITAGFTGVWAIALLALPIFLSAMVGLSISSAANKPKAPRTHLTTTKVVTAKGPLFSDMVSA